MTSAFGECQLPIRYQMEAAQAGDGYLTPLHVASMCDDVKLIAYYSRD